MNNQLPIKIIECPRDAMQGWKTFIPTDKKIKYINALLKVGFDTIDFGSFVSPKAIPQMSDTKEVLKQLDQTDTTTSLLAIIANLRGAEEACKENKIKYLGFPFSISETFQLRNTNSTIAESLIRVKEIQNICNNTGKKLVIYISMGFGNPYGDLYNEQIVFNWVKELTNLGINIISLADTVGVAEAEQVEKICTYLINAFPNVEIGVHLHSTSINRNQKLQAAVSAGCKRIDGALKGFGGCPMANDELVGNMDTESIISYLQGQHYNININYSQLALCSKMAAEIFV